ncbi:MAG TPA: hypothetical protein VH701_04905 [Vicinamibacterales bacterium]
MRPMIVLRYVYVLALVAWLGGILDRIFRARQIGPSALGAVMLAALIGMRLLGPKPVHFNIRMAIVFVMFATALYAAFGTPIFRGPISDIPTILTTIVLVGGLSLLYWEAREW